MPELLVEVHSKAECPYCEEVRQFLTDQGVKFVELKHDDEQERQQFYDSLGLQNEPGKPPQRTVPQVIVIDPTDGERMRIGGAAETKKSGIASLLRL
jgi:glutaredoxin